MAIRRLVENKIDTVGFGNLGGTVVGCKIITNLREIKTVHTVTLYMNPKRQIPFYDFFLQLRPKRFIFNPGTENPELERMLRQQGVETLEACTLVMLATGTY